MTLKEYWEIFRKIEDYLEDHALFEFMDQDKEGDVLELDAARQYYFELDKIE